MLVWNQSAVEKVVVTGHSVAELVNNDSSYFKQRWKKKNFTLTYSESKIQ